MILPIGKINKRFFKISGFTLIEILLVIVIMAILIAVSVPNFTSSIKGVHLKQTQEDLRSIARWAQAMAVAQRRTYVLVLDQDHYQMQRIKDEDTQELETVDNPLGRQRTLPSDVQIQTDVDHLQFHPDGTIDPATIRLKSDSKTISLSSAVMRGVLTVVEE